jgi:hypothetical protein
MQNPLYNKPHLREYLLYGVLAAIGYLLFVVIFLVNNKYENIYLLFFGNVAFILSIAIHAILQIRRKFEGQSTVRMLISSHLAIIVGVVLAVILSIIAVFVFFGDLSDVKPTDAIVEDGKFGAGANRPSGLLMMILIYATVPNFALSSFISVIISYVWKRNQTKDKPAELDQNIHVIEK